VSPEIWVAIVGVIGAILVAIITTSVNRRRRTGRSIPPPPPLPVAVLAHPPAPSSERATGDDSRHRLVMARLRAADIALTSQAKVIQTIEVRLSQVEHDQGSGREFIAEIRRDLREHLKVFHEYQRTNERELGAIAAKLEADE
jgi:hypothetical protein